MRAWTKVGTRATVQTWPPSLACTSGRGRRCRPDADRGAGMDAGRDREGDLASEPQKVDGFDRAGRGLLWDCDSGS